MEKTNMNSATQEPVRVDAERLKQFVASVFEDLGLHREDAELSADAVVQTDMRGQHTHGVFYLPLVAATIRGGSVRAASRPAIVRETLATAVVDGDGGIGYAVAAKACDIAAQKARAAGTATVLVRNSNFFGAASYYTQRLAEQGLIGIVSANSTPGVAAPGTRAPVIGTQPISYGIPDPDGKGTIVLDIAISQVAGTKIRQALERGESIPEGWMLGADGLPTTDPHDLDRGGLMVPFGGHKGFGIGILVEILAGVLSGAGVTHGVLHNDVSAPSNTGHWVTAIDPEAFMDRAEFNERLGALRAEIHAVPTREGLANAILPGEPEFEHELESIANGLELEGIVWDRVVSVARDLGRLEDLQNTLVNNETKLQDAGTGA